MKAACPGDSGSTLGRLPSRARYPGHGRDLHAASRASLNGKGVCADTASSRSRPNSWKQCSTRCRRRTSTWSRSTEAMRRLKAERVERRSVSLLDDGHRDNLEHVILVQAPLAAALLLRADGLSGRARLSCGGSCWRRSLRRANEIELPPQWVSSGSCPPRPLRRRKRVRPRRSIGGCAASTRRPNVAAWSACSADRHEIDIGAMTHDLIMSWDEIRGLATDPLVTIGAHTKGHYAIAKLSPEKAREELEEAPTGWRTSSACAPPISAFPMAMSAAHARETSPSPRARL